LLGRERWLREGREKAEKEKSRLRRACKGSALKPGIGLDRKRNFPPHRGQGWRGLRAAHIAGTLTNKRKV
ncbi:MAG: hypothetical protein ACLUVP_06890, partial [Acutalibacter sp.]